MTDPIFDLVVIGGGINGVGIALDAQGRGLSTALIEKKDLASATSSASSKLIHGGLRYLEHYEFRLVREALSEREVMLKKAPHLVKPLRFIMPHRKQLRPAWMIRAGLFLYDVLGKRDVLPSSRFLRFNPATSPLNAEFTKGFEYSDCWVDDARLVALNAVQFRDLGGTVLTYSQCTGATQVDDLWHVTVRDTDNGSERTLKARGLINAAGPWVESLLTTAMARTSPYHIQLIRGSHMVVPRLYDDDRAYILQNSDDRIVFVIPYLDHFSLIGTTDVKHSGSADEASISAAEIDYLCAVVNDHFQRKVSAADIVWTYSGVRALCDDESDSPQALTRDYTIALQTVAGLPLLSVFGGKLTTYRKLSEAALNKLKPFFAAMKPPWTESSLLPGGDMGMAVGDYSRQLLQHYPFLLATTARRLATCYGARAEIILKGASSSADLGRNFGQQFTEAELNYLVDCEFVRKGEDALWRLSKMGLFLDNDQQQAVADYIDAYVAGRSKNPALTAPRINTTA